MSVRDGSAGLGRPTGGSARGPWGGSSLRVAALQPVLGERPEKFRLLAGQVVTCRVDDAVRAPGVGLQGVDLVGVVDDPVVAPAAAPTPSRRTNDFRTRRSIPESDCGVSAVAAAVVEIDRGLIVDLGAGDELLDAAGPAHSRAASSRRPSPWPRARAATTTCRCALGTGSRIWWAGGGGSSDTSASPSTRPSTTPTSSTWSSRVARCRTLCCCRARDRHPLADAHRPRVADERLQQGGGTRRARTPHRARVSKWSASAPGLYVLTRFGACRADSP